MGSKTFPRLHVLSRNSKCPQLPTTSERSKKQMSSSISSALLVRYCSQVLFEGAASDSRLFIESESWISASLRPADDDLVIAVTAFSTALLWTLCGMGKDSAVAKDCSNPTKRSEELIFHIIWMIWTRVKRKISKGHNWRPMRSHKSQELRLSRVVRTMNGRLRWVPELPQSLRNGLVRTVEKDLSEASDLIVVMVRWQLPTCIPGIVEECLLFMDQRILSEKGKSKFEVEVWTRKCEYGVPNCSKLFFPDFEEISRISSCGHKATIHGNDRIWRLKWTVKYLPFLTDCHFTVARYKPYDRNLWSL